MSIYSLEENTNVVAVYYKGEPNMFRIHMDITLCDLKDQLEQIDYCLNRGYTRRVNNVKYPCMSIDSYECVQFIHMKLHNDDDVRIIFFILVSIVRRDWSS
jgi:hypothetical protein